MKCVWGPCDLCRSVELRSARYWAFAAGIAAACALAFAIWRAW